MKHFNLNNMVRGWFVGDINPSVYRTKDCEVAIKRYKAGEYEKAHRHDQAEEVTVIVSGEVLMNGIKYIQDDIVLIEKGEYTDFQCLTDVVTCVFKSKSVPGDKIEK